MDTAAKAEAVLSQATLLTTIGDQESDMYPYWAMPRREGVHRLGRAYADRVLVGGGTLHQAAATWLAAGRRTLDLTERMGRPARRATLDLRFGTVSRIKRPRREARSLPDRVELTLVEVTEPAPPQGFELLHWRLLSTHAVAHATSAWRIVIGIPRGGPLSSSGGSRRNRACDWRAANWRAPRACSSCRPSRCGPPP